MISELTEIVKLYQNELYAGLFGIATGVAEAMRAWDNPTEDKYIPEALAIAGAAGVALKSIKEGHSGLHAAADIGIVVSTYILSRVVLSAYLAGRRHPRPLFPDQKVPRE